jgi:DNA-binding FadR family transcriptional regulator
MNATRLKALHDSVDHASCLPARLAWEHKAAAHAEIFDLLAEVSDDPVADRVLIGAASCMQDLMLSVGTAADGMVVSSRRRLLGCLRAGDADGAALEMEYHLRALHFMWRLARPSRGIPA